MGAKSNILILISILLLCVIVFRPRHRSYNIVPRIIWTYWDNPEKIPKTVKMCIEGWKKNNPGYEVILLTKDNYSKYIHIPLEIAQHPNFNDSAPRFSDLLRLYVLAEHGGVWVDSSILLKAPLNSWLFPRPAEFSGFYISSFTKEGLPPVIESWFFACNKGSRFVQLWRDEFLQIANYESVEKYVESRKRMGVDYEKISGPIYLAIHVAAQKVLQIDKYPQDALILQKAEDGPFRYLVDSKWDSEKALHLACSNKSYQYPIMKMRGDERNLIEKKIDNDLSPSKCGWLD